MGTLLTVVGGCSRGGAAAASFSQRSRAAVSVIVAMRSSSRRKWAEMGEGVTATFPAVITRGSRSRLGRGGFLAVLLPFQPEFRQGLRAEQGPGQLPKSSRGTGRQPLPRGLAQRPKPNLQLVNEHFSSSLV